MASIGPDPAPRLIRAELISGGNTKNFIKSPIWRGNATLGVARGIFKSQALTTRALVLIAQGEPEQAERDAHDALGIAATTGSHLLIPDVLDCLAALAGDAGSPREVARLFGAGHTIRQRMGSVRFKVFDAAYENSVAVLRDALGENNFDSTWAEGRALSTEEAIGLRPARPR